MAASVVDVPTLRAILEVLKESSFHLDQGMAGWISETYFDPPLAEDEKTLTVDKLEDFSKLYEAYKRVRDLTNKTQEKWPFFRENGKAIGRGEAKAMTAAPPEAVGQIITTTPAFIMAEAETVQQAPPIYPTTTAAPLLLESTPEPKVAMPSLSPSEASSTAKRALLAVESESVITNLDSRPSSRGSRATPGPAASKRNKRKVELNESVPAPRKRAKKEHPAPAPSRRSSRNKPNRASPEPVKGPEPVTTPKAQEAQPYLTPSNESSELGADFTLDQTHEPSYPELDERQRGLSPKVTPDPHSEAVVPALDLNAEESPNDVTKSTEDVAPNATRETPLSVQDQHEIAAAMSPQKSLEVEHKNEAAIPATVPKVNIVTVARIQTAEEFVEVELGPGTWGGNVDLILEYLSWKKKYGNADIGFEVFCNITRFARAK